MDDEAQVPATSPDLKATSYLWQVPGKPVSVRLEFEVIDRLLEEAMGGFGLVPRKCVEVGGILLGNVERVEPDRWLVTVTDFEPVACSHARGLNWLFSEEETAVFEETARRLSIVPDRQAYAVGMFRSHGREGFGLEAEDIELWNRHFPDPWAVALLVRPFATRVSTGALFIREGGQIQSNASYLEFPFRRKELGGEAAGTDWPRTSATGAEERVRSVPAALETPSPPVTMSPVTAAPEPVETNQGWSRWFSILLAFLFLLIGVVVGFQAAIRLGSQIAAVTGQDPFTMGLSVAPSGDSSLDVRWNRAAPAIEAAKGGTLDIRDGENEKKVSLDAAQLRNGSVVYRRATKDVTIRLEVTAKEGVTLAETVRYRGQ